MKQDIIWAAGFMDGEGSFMIKRYKSKNCKRGITFQPYISCAQTIKGKIAIEKLKDIFGGHISIYKQTGNKYDTIIWGVVSRKALKCAKILKKYLILKRQGAELIIRFYVGHKGKGKGICSNKTSDRSFKKKENMFWEMRKLNQKGCLRLKRLSEETPKGDAIV